MPYPSKPRELAAEPSMSRPNASPMRRPSDAEFAQLIAQTAELVKESRRLLDQLQQNRDAERRALLTAKGGTSRRTRHPTRTRPERKTSS